MNVPVCTLKSSMRLMHSDRFSDLANCSQRLHFNRTFYSVMTDEGSHLLICEVSESMAGNRGRISDRRSSDGMVASAEM